MIVHFQLSNASVEASGNHTVLVSTSCLTYAQKPDLQSNLELLPWKAYFFLVADYKGNLDGLLVGLRQRLN
jgi:hypothetical protein